MSGGGGRERSAEVSAGEILGVAASRFGRDKGERKGEREMV